MPALGALPVLWVGVRCDSAVVAGREIARGDRVAGQAASQADTVHQGVVYRRTGVRGVPVQVYLAG
jgi:chloramphenicol 3-O phosphotransferase